MVAFSLVSVASSSFLTFILPFFVLFLVVITLLRTSTGESRARSFFPPRREDLDASSLLSLTRPFFTLLFLSQRLIQESYDDEDEEL